MNSPRHWNLYFETFVSEGKKVRINIVEKFIEGCQAQREKDLIKREQEEAGTDWVFTDKGPLGGGYGFRPEKKEKEILPTLDPWLEKHNGTVYTFAPFIVVFDDIADEVRNTYVTELIRLRRHLHCKVIISSQYSMDNKPVGRANVNSWFLWGGIDLTSWRWSTVTWVSRRV